jgi:hypothetical protein
MSATKAPGPSEIDRSANWDTIHESLKELMNCRVEEALVGFEADLEEEYDYVQFVVLDANYGTCMAVKWQNQKNLLEAEAQARLRDQRFRMRRRGLEAHREVYYDDLEALADLADWVFIEVFGLGNTYRMRVVNAPWL